MANAKKLLRNEDVRRILDCSYGTAATVIKELNEELQAQGYRVIAGRIDREYLKERYHITAL